MEPITVARKPLTGTVAANILEHGTGALNIDGCRVGRDADDTSGWSQSGSKASDNRAMSGGNYAREAKPDADGRWPANLIHDGGEEVLALFPQAKGQSGAVGPQHGAKSSVNVYGDYGPREDFQPRGDFGSAARFFYTAKASKADRDEGCEGLEKRRAGGMQGRSDGSMGSVTLSRNIHPTVKPTDLMRYLCRLVTPEGGIVFDPFMGSGSTGKAAMLEGFRFIGIEREAEYVEIARRRIAKVTEQGTLF